MRQAVWPARGFLCRFLKSQGLILPFLTRLRLIIELSWPRNAFSVGSRSLAREIMGYNIFDASKRAPDGLRNT